MLACLFALPAQAQQAGESRLALVIGNASYKSSPLANPVNDARLMEAALKEAGFTVIKAENASIREMRRLVRDFGDRLKASGGVGLFYFAGHGLQVRGENYLVSVDSDIRNEDEVADDAINANVILEKMQTAGNRMNLIILDACRNNPFAVRTRNSASGLATMNAPSGSLVAYSTAPGSVASDGTGSNGLYTMHLARAIRQAGLPVEEVFKQVRAAVRRDSSNQQTPWENTALEGQFYFRPAVQPAAAPAPAAPVAAPAPAPAPGPSAATVELAFWDSVKSSTNEGELQAYLSRYPNGVFADLARARIAALKSAAAERAAADRIAAERAAADRASAALAAQSARVDPNAADIAFWEGIKLSTRPAELQAYLDRFPNGLFAGLVRARLAEIQSLASAPRPAPVAMAAPSPQPGSGTGAVAPAPAGPAAAGTGRLTIKDQLTGKSEVMDVYPLSTDGGVITFSTGDMVAANGVVRAVRVGAYVITTDTGSLWTLPLQPGAAGQASLRGKDGSEFQATWRVTKKEANLATVELRYLHSIGTASPTSGFNRRPGLWVAQYSDDVPVPIWTRLEARMSGFVEMMSSEWTRAVVAPPVAVAAPHAAEVVGTLQLRDRTLNKTQNMDVTVARTPNRLTYSTGEVVQADGLVRVLTMGNISVEVTTGELWRFPLQAGQSGSARANMLNGESGFIALRWKTAAAPNGHIRIDVDFNYESGTLFRNRYGTWTATYVPDFHLPMQFELVMRASGSVPMTQREAMTGELKRVATR